MPLGDDNPARLIEMFPSIGPAGELVYVTRGEAFAPIALARIIAAGILVLIAGLGLTGIVAGESRNRRRA